METAIVPASRVRVMLTITFLALVSLGSLYSLIHVWPAASFALSPQSKQEGPAATTPATTSGPTTSAPAAPPGACSITELWDGNRSCGGEGLLLWVTLLAGAIGSLIHAWTSLATYVGNRSYVASWTLWYCARPLVGAMLALLFYVVVRGGFLGTSVSPHDLNLYSFTALAGLVGMFSKQASDKLEEVFSVLFKASAGKGDEKRTDKVKAIEPINTGAENAAFSDVYVAPTSVPRGKDTTLWITGKGLTAASRVFVDGNSRAAAWREQDSTLGVQILATDVPVENEHTLQIYLGDESEPIIKTVPIAD